MIKSFILIIFIVLSIGHIKEVHHGRLTIDTSYLFPYIKYIQNKNPKLPESKATEIVEASSRWAREFNLDKKLILAIQQVESMYRPHAISESGAYGLMQVIPVWHKDKIIRAKKELGNPEIFNINTNIFLGTLVLHECMKRTKRVTSKALLCYSGQTPGYDKKVLSAYYKIKRL
jgi:soluble lytic murein transglycosylase-like protein